MSGQGPSSGSSPQNPVEKLREEMEIAFSGKPMDEESRDRSVFGRLDKHNQRLSKLEKQSEAGGLNWQTIRNAALTAIVGGLVYFLLSRLGLG